MGVLYLSGISFSLIAALISCAFYLRKPFFLCVVERCSLMLVYHQLFGLKVILYATQARAIFWEFFWICNKLKNETLIVYFLLHLSPHWTSIECLKVFLWGLDTQQNGTQHNDIQHNDIQHNDIQHNDIQHKLYWVGLCRLSHFICCYAECCYAECHYA